MAEGLFGTSMTSSTDSRGAFRTTVDVDSSRRQREATTVQLRKTKKEERLNRRRKLAPSTPAPQVSISADMPSIAEGLNSDDPAKQYTAAGKCRRMLSVEKNPPIDMVIDAGLVPRLVQLLSTESHPSLQFEAAWALTNVASGTSQHTQTVIDSGAVPVFVQLLSSNSKEVREQAIWALGNVAGDSARCRDLVLGSGALNALINLISPTSPITLLRNATWALSNLCRGKPPPEFQKVKAALPALAALLQGNDSEVLTDSCWGLSYLSDGPNEKIQCVIDSGVVGRCVELLGHPEVAVQTPALRTVGNIVTGDDSQTEEVLKTPALNFLKDLLSSEKKGIRKEACWTLSNITAGNSEQIQKVLDADIFPRLIKMLSIEQFEIQKEAVWAVSNATAGGSPNQVAALVKMGCVRPLCELLEVSDSKILLVALEGVENVLKAGAMDAQNTGGENIVARLVEECEGLDKIENLQTHHEKMVYAKATKILTNFYDTESEEAFEMNQSEMNFNAGNNGFNMQGGFK